MMRLRYPFAGTFLALLLGSAYIGLTPSVVAAVNDKFLHFLVFFLLTLTLYWSIDLPRRLVLKVVLASMLALAVGSEFLQAALPNGRNFDPIDIVANLVGTSLALTLCGWYHKRMLERKRKRKLQGYGIVADGEGEQDVELGEGGSSSQEMGVVAEDEDDGGGEAWDDIGGNESAEGPIKANGVSKAGEE